MAVMAIGSSYLTTYKRSGATADHECFRSVELDVDSLGHEVTCGRWGKEADAHELPLLAVSRLLRAAARRNAVGRERHLISASVVSVIRFNLPYPASRSGGKAPELRRGEHAIAVLPKLAQPEGDDVLLDVETFGEPGR